MHVFEVWKYERVFIQGLFRFSVHWSLVNRANYKQRKPVRPVVSESAKQDWSYYRSPPPKAA